MIGVIRGWIPLRVYLLGECWTDAWMSGNCPYDSQPAQTASYQSDALDRWAEIRTRRRQEAFINDGVMSWTSFQCTSINRLPEKWGERWMWGVKILFPLSLFKGSWYDSQLNFHRMCVCTVRTGLFARKEETDGIRCGGRQHCYPNTDLSRGFCTAGKPTRKAPISNPPPPVRTVSPHFRHARQKQIICPPLGGWGRLNPFLVTSVQWCNSDSHHYILKYIDFKIFIQKKNKNNPM